MGFVKDFSRLSGNKCFSLNMLLLHILGCCIDKRMYTQHWKYNLHVIWSVIVYLTSLSLLIQLSHVYWTSTDIKEISINAGVTLAHFPNAVILYSFIFISKRLRVLLLNIEKTYSNMKKSIWFENCISPAENCLRMCKPLTIAYCLGVTVTASAYCVQPLFQDGVEIETGNNRTFVLRKLPLNLYPRSQFIDPSYFYIEFLLIQVPEIYLLCAITCAESLYLVLTLFEISQFEVLIQSFKATEDTCEKGKARKISLSVIDCKSYDNVEYFSLERRNIQHSNKDFNDNDMHYDRITEAVKLHQQLIGQVKDLQKLIGPSLFVHLLVSSAGVCMYGYLAIISEIGWPSLIYYSSVILILSRLGMYCFLGNRLSEKSLEVGHAAYNSNWHTTGTYHHKFGILMIIRRSQKPTALTAAGFSTLSLHTYLGILQASYSYITLLMQVNDK